MSAAVLKKAKKAEVPNSFKQVLVSDLKNLVLVFVAAAIGMQIVFYNESISNVLRLVMSLFWLYALPGIALLYYWHDKLSFAERFVVGFAVSVALTGSLSYYMGLIGIHSIMHGYILPPLFMIAGLITLLLKLDKNKAQGNNK